LPFVILAPALQLPFNGRAGVTKSWCHCIHCEVEGSKGNGWFLEFIAAPADQRVEWDCDCAVVEVSGGDLGRGEGEGGGVGWRSLFGIWFRVLFRVIYFDIAYVVWVVCIRTLADVLGYNIDHVVNHVRLKMRIIFRFGFFLFRLVEFGFVEFELIHFLLKIIMRFFTFIAGSSFLFGSSSHFHFQIDFFIRIIIFNILI